VLEAHNQQLIQKEITVTILCSARSLLLLAAQVVMKQLIPHLQVVAEEVKEGNKPLVLHQELPIKVLLVGLVLVPLFFGLLVVVAVAVE
jgi:hypothetical protein